MTSRLVALPAPLARLLLALVAAIVAAGVLAPSRDGTRLGPAARGDAALYRAVAARTAHDGYYPAAAAEHRARGYPLRPFVAVREPALAWLAARAGPAAMPWLLRLLAAAALGATLWRLPGGKAERIAAMAIAAASIAMLADPALAVWHEAWAALLLALAIAIRGERRWWPACLAALAAMLVRELAAPAVAAMAVAALVERRRAEAVGWAAALAAFAAAMALHAAAVAAVTLPGDLASPGWARFGGWGFVLAIARAATLFGALPVPLAAAGVPLALLGWATVRGGFAARAALALGFTVLPFMAVGRPDNVYWGVMLAPLLPAGLAYAPRALADLVRAARQAPRPAPSVRPCRADASS